MTTDKKTVAVTGCSGYIGSAVTRALCADPRVETVVGFDVAAPDLTDPRFVFDHLDVRDPGLAKRLAGVDVVVHLAFVMDPIRDEELMRDVNVNGTQNVLRASGDAGVPHVIYCSSAVVYGAHPDNDFPLTEDSPLRANLDLSYAAHKLEVEYVVAEIRDAFPDLRIAVLRPATVLGGDVDSAWAHLLEAPILFSVKGLSPPLQFVHQQDVVAAVAWAVFAGLDGPYNVAPAGYLEVPEMLAIVGRRRVEVPEAVAFGVAERLWRSGLAELPSGFLHYVMHPWVVGVDKLSEAGFTCVRSSSEALAAAATSARGYVRVGPARLRRRALWAGGAAGVGAAAVALALRRRGR